MGPKTAPGAGLGDEFDNRKKLSKYLAKVGGWIIKNFGDEIRKFAAEEKKRR